MNEARTRSAAAHHKDLGFLVTGGVPGPKSSTEISKDGITFEAFTPLPVGLAHHCAVALDGDNGDFFIAGGATSSGDLSKRAFIHRGNQWVEMKQMDLAHNSGKKPNLEKKILR